MFRVRDFVETREGLLFSVVSNLHPSSGILAQLRFRRTDRGLVKMNSSAECQKFLSRLHPGYVRFCAELDREVTVVPEGDVVDHFQPAARLGQLIRKAEDADINSIVSELASRSGLRESDLGITGSFLVGAQNRSSDIDLVVYGLSNYARLQDALRESVARGVFSRLGRRDWARLYQKRVPDSSDYSFREFIWHESRKWDRAKLGNRRFDVLSARRTDEISGRFSDAAFKRLGKARASCTVTDSRLAHDYPARYSVSDCRAQDHEVSEVVSFTHTYSNQVREGERALCSGILEQVSGIEPHFRILIGSSREAPGEFLKVTDLASNP